MTVTLISAEINEGHPLKAEIGISSIPSIPSIAQLRHTLLKIKKITNAKRLNEFNKPLIHELF